MRLSGGKKKPRGAAAMLNVIAQEWTMQSKRFKAKAVDGSRHSINCFIREPGQSFAESFVELTEVDECQIGVSQLVSDAQRTV